MALSASQVWEVRTTGASTNGGGFKAGASGTDRSQQDAAQVVVDNAAITATTAGAASNVLTFAGYTPTAADIGNVFQATGGTNITAGFYEITAQTGTTWTVSGAANLTTAGGAGAAIVGNMGGALASLSNLNGPMLASNRVWVKSGTYVHTAGITFTASSVFPAFNLPQTLISGYAVTRGDITVTSTNQSSRPLLQFTTANTVNGISLPAGSRLQHIQVGVSGAGTVNTGVVISGNFSVAHNLKVSGYGWSGGSAINFGGAGCACTNCEVTAGLAGCGPGILGGIRATIEQCNVHDTPGSGYSTGYFLECVASNCTGATSDGFVLPTSEGTVHFCTVYGCGRHGVNLQSPSIANRVRGNIFDSNGGYGLTNTAGAGIPASPELDGNAYRSNTSGTRNNVDDTTTNAVDGVGPYINQFDITAAITASPFVNAAGNDFRLNATAGAGALLRGTAPVNTVPGLTVAGYRDFGALQHQDAPANVFWIGD
jgi:hypothetical protein